MSYLDFVVQPFNLPFLAAVVAGLGVLLYAQSSDRDLFLVHAGLLSLGIAGLTVNGAVHDFALGDPAGHFPRVLAGSLVLAALATGAGKWVRDRFFPPIRQVRFNERGLDGVEARVVSERVETEPGSGRAQWHDGEGALHVVVCHTGEGSVGFGRTVRLEAFDDEHDSYRVSPV